MTTPQNSNRNQMGRSRKEMEEKLNRSLEGRSVEKMERKVRCFSGEKEGLV